MKNLIEETFEKRYVIDCHQFNDFVNSFFKIDGYDSLDYLSKNEIISSNGCYETFYLDSYLDPKDLLSSISKGDFENISPDDILSYLAANGVIPKTEYIFLIWW